MSELTTIRLMTLKPVLTELDLCSGVNQPSTGITWADLTSLLVPCGIVTNLYLPPPPPHPPAAELTFPQGCAPSAHRQARHAPLGAHHAPDPS